MKKWIIIGALVVVAAVIAVVTYLYQKPTEKTVSGEAAYALDAATLFNEFNEDEAKANEKYVNKVIAVKGTISEVMMADSIGMNIMLASQNPVFGVSCQVPGQSKTALKEGDEIEIKGLCTGKLMDVVLIKCVVEN
jgi:hypothetical protein